MNHKREKIDFMYTVGSYIIPIFSALKKVEISKFINILENIQFKNE